MVQIKEQLEDLKKYGDILDKQCANLLDANIFKSEYKHPTIEYLSDDKLVLVGRTKIDKAGEKFSNHSHENSLEFIVLLTGGIDIDLHGTKKSLNKFLDFCPINYKEEHSAITTKDNTEFIHITIPAENSFLKL